MEKNKKPKYEPHPTKLYHAGITFILLLVSMANGGNEKWMNI